MPDHESTHGSPRPLPDQSAEPPHPQAEFRLTTDDPELQRLVDASLEAIGPENLNDIVVNHERFDSMPMRVRQPDGSDKEVTHFSLRRLLGRSPDYAASAAEAGIDTDQASDLIKTLQAETEQGFEYTAEIDVSAALMARAFSHQADHGQQLTPEDYGALQGMLASTARNSHSAGAANVYRSLSRLGANTQDSVGIITNELRGDLPLMRPAVRMFDSLSIADVEAGQLAEVCGRLVGEKSSLLGEVGDDFDKLRDLFAFVGPRQGIAPADMLAAVNERLAAGEDMPTIARTIASREAKVLPASERSTDAAELDDYQARRERHFPEKTGELENAELPYRTQRSLEDGVRDLEQIAQDTGELGMPSEGSWAFDAATNTWYSFGGRTEVFVGQAVKHNHLPYPVGELSRRPSLFHCRPVAHEHAIGFRAHDNVVPPDAVPLANRLLGATPNTADYRAIAETLQGQQSGIDALRAFIVHGSGITEYTFPLDAQTIEDVSEYFGDIRSGIIELADWNKLMEQPDANEALAELIDAYNARLPSGFKLKYFPTGTAIK